MKISLASSGLAMVASVLIALLAPVAYAQPLPHLSDTVVPFAGLAAGFQSVRTNYAEEINKKGFDVQLKGLLSWYQERWVLDGGAGYNWSRIHGTDRYRARVRTDSFLLDLAARYRVTEKIQVGPLVEGLMGANQSYAESNDGTKDFLGYVGVQTLYDFSFPSAPFVRLGGQALIDFTDSKRNNFLLLAELQVGFPLRPKAAQPVHSAEEAEAKATATVSSPRSVQVVLPKGLFLFATSVTKLRKEQMDYLNTLAKVLSRDLHRWESARVSGHTDDRGPLALNDRISQQRATSVLDGLVASGIPRDRLDLQAKGPREPVAPNDSDATRLQNRRVEIEILGVSEPQALSDEINHLQ